MSPSTLFTTLNTGIQTLWTYAQNNPTHAAMGGAALIAAAILRKKIVGFAAGFFAGIIAGAIISAQAATIPTLAFVTVNTQLTMLVWGIIGGCAGACYS